MRIVPSTAAVIATLSAFLLAPAFAVSQEESPFLAPVIPAHHNLLLGYMDQQTGSFQPLTNVVPSAATTTFAGTTTVTLHITLKTAPPSGGKVACYANLIAGVSGPNGNATYSETAYAVATVSGTTATCTILIPHSWTFPTPTATSVESLVGTYSGDIINPSATSASQLPLLRESRSTFISVVGPTVLTTAPSAFSINVTL